MTARPPPTTAETSILKEELKAQNGSLTGQQISTHNKTKTDNEQGSLREALRSDDV
jgi:hypothetical protein